LRRFPSVEWRPGLSTRIHVHRVARISWRTWWSRTPGPELRRRAIDFQSVLYASVHSFDRLELCYGPRHNRRVQSGHEVEFSALIVATTCLKISEPFSQVRRCETSPR